MIFFVCGFWTFPRTQYSQTIYCGCTMQFMMILIRVQEQYQNRRDLFNRFVNIILKSKENPKVILILKKKTNKQTNKQTMTCKIVVALKSPLHCIGILFLGFCKLKIITMIFYLQTFYSISVKLSLSWGGLYAPDRFDKYTFFFGTFSFWFRWLLWFISLFYATWCIIVLHFFRFNQKKKLSF